MRCADAAYTRAVAMPSRRVPNWAETAWSAPLGWVAVPAGVVWATVVVEECGTVVVLAVDCAALVTGAVPLVAHATPEPPTSMAAPRTPDEITAAGLADLGRPLPARPLATAPPIAWKSMGAAEKLAGGVTEVKPGGPAGEGFPTTPA